jgi:hypothetical protein
MSVILNVTGIEIQYLPDRAIHPVHQPVDSVTRSLTGIQ